MTHPPKRRRWLLALLPAAALCWLAATPKEAELVDASAWIPDLVVDLRYAQEDNLFGKAVYPEGARCLLLRSTAARLQKVADALRREDGTRLRVFDCYRPHAVQFEMWKIMPVRGYVAPPKGGSVHNRGGAVDLTLAAPDGSALPMPTDHDELTERAWHAYEGGTEVQRSNRSRLRAAMVAQGFRTIRKEWWHYEDPDAKGAPILDVPLVAPAIRAPDKERSEEGREARDRRTERTEGSPRPAPDGSSPSRGPALPR